MRYKWSADRGVSIRKLIGINEVGGIIEIGGINKYMRKYDFPSSCMRLI